MTKREVASFVVRMTGLVMLIAGVGKAPIWVSSAAVFSQNMQTDFWLRLSVIGMHAAAVLYVVACIWIAVKSDWIAARLVRVDGVVDPIAAPSMHDMLTVAFCVTGLVFAIESVPKLFQTLMAFAYMRGLHTADGRLNVQLLTDIVARGVQLIAAIFLFFGAEGLANIWRRMREYRGSVNSDKTA